MFEGTQDKLARRRNFFVDYAKEQGFDPLIVDNWYIEDLSEITRSQVSI